MSVLAENVREFIDGHKAGVFSTIRPDGRARQTVAYYILEDDRILMSTESQRFKARDVERTGWASLCIVDGEKPFASVTVEGRATIRSKGIADDTARIFVVTTGGDPPTLTDEGLAAVDRVILEIRIERVYAVQHVKGSPVLFSRWAQASGGDAATAEKVASRDSSR